ncbi:MAG: lysine--tRNA ligase, partial [Thermosphaera sp.]
PANPTDFGIKRIMETLEKAARWVGKYGPENMVFNLANPPTPSQIGNIPEKYIAVFKKLLRNLEELEDWSEERIKNAMVDSTKELTPHEVNEYYKFFYKLFIGKENGPRAAPFISLLGRETALAYLEVFRK